ncbi:hypothetical protein JXA32_06865 [Candidatus Sumerlaeota bacterium]|nr:hypothetical protein [Candidatus Sumerlaeota bacterium]
MNRFLKCGIIAIIGLILLYGILTGLAHWFIENQTLTYIPACKADMRSLATALEAYRIDCGLYPAWGSGKQGVHADFSKDDPIYQLPTFRIWTSPDEHSAFALLSTPLGYINTYPPDHFAPKLGATYSYYTNGDFCILIGAAADQDYDIDPMTALDRTTSKTLISELADRLIEQQYDPTNGTFSDGDLFRILSSYE